MFKILDVNTFDKNNYAIEISHQGKTLMCCRNSNECIVKIDGSKDLISELVDTIVSLGLNFEKILISRENLNNFKREIVCKLSGFIEIVEDNNDSVLIKYQEANISTITLAGGCFWCMAKPYYEYEGILKVFSGYSGGSEVMPSYEKVKAQETSHKECVKLIYDSNIISLKKILDIYFETIDPFDDGGQFIDRGASYTTAIFYKNQKEKEAIQNYINQVESQLQQPIAVKILEESIFYMAEEYHQDYALKNPLEMEKELIESGRKRVF